MCFSAIAVANTILDMAAKRNIPDMTPMKLQKLVFLAHALYVKGHHRDKLFSDPIEKWQYGPVISEIYREFRGFGSNPISGYATNADGTVDIIPTQRTDIYDHLANVLDIFGSIVAWKLSELTHLTGTAWEIAKSPIISDEDVANGKIYVPRA